ncbi:MAG: hypothetical protein U5K00_13380 [Melioribacteraceae bacterium]|nr:hypothetical protein [Melioribacteraceae bacterium]
MLKRLTILFGVSVDVLQLATYSTTITIFRAHGVSPRTVGLDEADIFEYPFTGLQNVGVGTMVYSKFQLIKLSKIQLGQLLKAPDG